jgi:3-hydroxyisobutyrate dehydrogenase
VKVAFIGMGTMGAPMALNLLKAGHGVIVHNRTRDREVPIAEAGAERADSPAAAAETAEVVITCVSDTADVEQVILGENGVMARARPGTVVVDMSTISPTVTRAIAATLAEKAIAMVDAPVSGGSEGAKNGTLSIMVGGDQADVAKVTPVLKAMGKTITHIGQLGQGSSPKPSTRLLLQAPTGPLPRAWR